MKKVAERLCDWLETNLWGFDSSLSRGESMWGRPWFSALKRLAGFGRMQALQRYGKGAGIHGVIRRSSTLFQLIILHV